MEGGGCGDEDFEIALTSIRDPAAQLELLEWCVNRGKGQSCGGRKCVWWGPQANSGITRQQFTIICGAPSSSCLAPPRRTCARVQPLAMEPVCLDALNDKATAAAHALRSLKPGLSRTLAPPCITFKANSVHALCEQYPFFKNLGQKYILRQRKVWRVRFSLVLLTSWRCRQAGARWGSQIAREQSRCAR